MQCSLQVIEEQHYIKYKTVEKDSKQFTLGNTIKMAGNDNHFLIYNIFQLKNESKSINIIGVNLSLLASADDAEDLDGALIFEFIDVNSASIIKQQHAIGTHEQYVATRYTEFFSLLIPETKSSEKQPEEEKQRKAKSKGRQTRKPAQPVQPEGTTTQEDLVIKQRRSSRTKKARVIEDIEDEDYIEEPKQSKRKTKDLSDDDMPSSKRNKRNNKNNNNNNSNNNNNNEALTMMTQQLSTLTAQQSQLLSKFATLEEETALLKQQLKQNQTAQQAIAPQTLVQAPLNFGGAGTTSQLQQLPTPPFAFQAQPAFQTQPIIVLMPQAGPDNAMMQLMRQIQQIQYR